MASPAQDSDAILSAARASLADQRAGGRRVPRGRPIGQRSAAMRSQRMRKLGAVCMIVGAVFCLMGFAADLAVGALHGSGMLAVVFALIAAFVTWRSFDRRLGPVIPTRDQLYRTPASKLIGNVELWLEAQRGQLPAPALDLVGQLGGKLDLLAGQLDRLDDSAPAVAQVRALVGEHLPEVVSAYTAIPAPLRAVRQAGSTPDEQLAQSLRRIGTEIDSVTAQLAEGAIDRLAIQTRYLDMKYGEGALPPPGGQEEG